MRETGSLLTEVKNSAMFRPVQFSGIDNKRRQAEWQHRFEHAKAIIIKLLKTRPFRKSFLYVRVQYLIYV